MFACQYSIHNKADNLSYLFVQSMMILIKKNNIVVHNDMWRCTCTLTNHQIGLSECNKTNTVTNVFTSASAFSIYKKNLSALTQVKSMLNARHNNYDFSPSKTHIT